MARSTSRYPIQYWALAEKVGEDGHQVDMEFDTRGQAHNFRQRFYAFRKAALKELTDEDRKIKFDAIYIELIESTDGKWIVSIIHRNNSKDGTMIDAALNKLKEAGL